MLKIKRPTSTTVLYTVSTRSPSTTLTARLSAACFTLFRILLGVAVLLILLVEYRSVALLPDILVLQDLELAVSQSPFYQFIHPNPEKNSDSRLWRLLLCAGVTWLISRKGYTEESLLVIRGLGVQTSTSSPSYLWTSGTRFIPTSSIQDIFIHEAFKGFEVRYYLSIVVEGEEAVVVVFPNILPRREILENVWRGAKACLYEPKT